MIRILLKSGELIEFELGDDKKENDLVMRFHVGLDGDAILNLKTNKIGSHSRIRVSLIKNMQHLKHKTTDASETDPHNDLYSLHDSKFKTREDYEKWKRQKIKDNRDKIRKLK